MSLINTMFNNSVTCYANKEATISNDIKLNYQEINNKIDIIANNLRKLGISSGDLVMLQLVNGSDIIMSYFALIRLGAIVVPLNVMYVAHEIAYICRDTNAKAIIVDVSLIDNIIEIRDDLKSLEHIIVVGDEIPNGSHKFSDLLSHDSFDGLECHISKPDDIISIIYTSGTTGRPKGATQTHRSIFANVSSCFTFNKFSSDDRLLCALPLFNNFAINVVMMSAFYSGATLIIVDRFEAEKVLNSITENRATYFAGTPTMFLYLLEAYDPKRHDVKSLRVVNCGGAHCPTKLIDDVERIFGVTFLNGYGQTEGCGFTTLNPVVGIRKKESVGIPLSNVWIKILDDNFVELPPNEIGEITEKGDVFSVHGYWKRPEINSEIYRKGWFSTGDLGYVDNDGYLYIIDRKQDLIITGGANIYPLEVEETLYQHEAVSMAAVIGIPDDIKGELAKAYIVLKKGKQATANEIIDFVRSRIAKYKAPRSVEFVEYLPQGPTGKILKRELKEMLSKK